MYNTASFTGVDMPGLIENIRSRTRQKTLKDWLIHMDNGRLHNLGRAQMCIEAPGPERLPHLVHSPDLAPSDFFLFGYIKGNLSGYSCESREDLLNQIAEIFTGVDRELLFSVFES
jgi:hypothetical protein